MTTPQPPSPAGPDDERSGMSGLQRAMIVLGAVAVLLLAFVLVQSGGDDDDGGTTAAQTTATQEPTTTTETTTETETTTTTETETTTTEEPTVPTIRVSGGEPQGGVRTLSFESGDEIRFKVRSDAADEVHVHGYDETKAVPANQTVELSFDASIEGRFEVEFHEAGTQIAELEVSPS